MNTMKILFVADPLESFKIYKDTTFAMMREAQKRGHQVVACEVTDVRWQRGEAVSALVREIHLTGDADQWFTETGKQRANLKDFGAVIMRKDPPFDVEYITSTWLLERAGLLHGNEIASTWGPLWFWACLALLVVAHDTFFYVRGVVDVLVLR